MSNTCNMETRIAIMSAGLTQRELAQRMGITYKWLSRKLAAPLTEAGKKQIEDAIRAYLGEEGAANEN